MPKMTTNQLSDNLRLLKQSSLDLRDTCNVRACTEGDIFFTELSVFMQAAHKLLDAMCTNLEEQIENEGGN